MDDIPSREFDCEDCGAHVIEIGRCDGPAQCGACGFIHELELPADEEAELRRRLAVKKPVERA
jgi:transcription elongation factor Elf1